MEITRSRAFRLGFDDGVLEGAHRPDCRARRAGGAARDAAPAAGRRTYRGDQAFQGGAALYRMRVAAQAAQRSMCGVRSATMSQSFLDISKVVAHRLGNGLEVRLLAERSVPTVSYYTFFKVGS